MTVIFELRQSQHLVTLLGEATAVQSGDELVELLNQNADETLVLVGPSVPLAQVLTFAEQARVRRPALGIVLLREYVEMNVVTDALRVGIREVVAAVDHAAILAACARSQDLSRQLIAAADSPAARPTGQAAVPAQPGARAESDPGQVVTVFAAKGGCGKSTIAINLAVTLAQGGQHRVCLMDLDLAFGDVAIMTQLVPEKTIADAIPVADRIDETGFRTLLTPYRPGVDILLAPVQPALAEQIGKDLITELIHLARADFDFVVIDTASAFSEQMLAALDATHHYVLVATPELPSLKNLRITLDMFELLDYRREARSVVLNRADAKVGLSMTDIERVIRVPIEGFVPSSRDVPIAANQGVPLAVANPSHPVSSAIRELAGKRFIEVAQEKTKRGLFARKKG